MNPDTTLTRHHISLCWDLGLAVSRLRSKWLFLSPRVIATRTGSGFGALGAFLPRPGHAALVLATHPTWGNAGLGGTLQIPVHSRWEFRWP